MRRLDDAMKLCPVLWIEDFQKRVHLFPFGFVRAQIQKKK